MHKNSLQKPCVTNTNGILNKKLPYSLPILEELSVEEQTKGAEFITHESNNGYYS